MKINIYTKLNGVGLEADARILTAALVGHDVVTINWDKPERRKADVGIHLEHIRKELIGLAPVNVAIPNPEWFDNPWIPLIPQMNAVLCKTHYTQSIFEKYTDKCRYIGFTSEDKHMEGIDRRFMFIHLAGKSSHKGTEYVRDVWRNNRALPLLYFQKIENTGSFIMNQPNVQTEFQRVPDIRPILNTSLFALCPSKAEGFGHYINEAMSAGCVVITTDAPPMNEIVPESCGFKVPAVVCGTHRLANEYCVVKNELKRVINEAINTPIEQLLAMSQEARRVYLKRDAEFKKAINECINNL